MTDETTAEAAAPAAPTVPAHIIPAALPHPNISAPLARGIQYMHHFEVLLVSDGVRLWDAASAEAKQLLADIKRENIAHADTVAAAQAAPAISAGVPAQSGTETTDPANPGNANAQA